MKIKYATATGLYEFEDFNGPPPFPYTEVYDKKEVDKYHLLLESKLEKILEKLQKEL